MAMLQVVSRLRVVGERNGQLSQGNTHRFHQVIGSLFKTLVVMLLLLHIICCSWILICKVGCGPFIVELEGIRKSYNYTNGTTPEDMLDDMTDHQKLYSETCWFARDAFPPPLITGEKGNGQLYLRTIFLSTAMFVSGENIEPTNVLEYMFGMIFILIGVAFTAIFYGQTMTLIHSLDARGIEFRKKMDHVNDTMEHLQLPTKLRERVNMYYWYSWYRYSNFSSNGMGQFLTELSEPLAMEVQLVCHSNVIGNIPLFKGVDSNVIRSVLLKIKPEIFLPGDYIFRHGDTAVKLYMIQSGTVEILTYSGEVLVTLEEGSYFGEVSLLTDVKRTASAKSTDYCTTDTLSKVSFNEIRAIYPEFNQMIVEMCEEKVRREAARNNIVNSPHLTQRGRRRTTSSLTRMTTEATRRPATRPRKLC